MITRSSPQPEVTDQEERSRRQRNEWLRAAVFGSLTLILTLILIDMMVETVSPNVDCKFSTECD